MQNTKNLILSLLLLVLFTGFALAQEAGTFHVFPRVIAGELVDGSERGTLFLATNVEGRPTTCIVKLIGMPDTMIDNGGVLSLPSQGSVALVFLEGGRVPPGVEVGYATMTCDHAVTGTAVLVQDPPGATPTEGLMTIYPAASSTMASILLVMIEEFGSGVLVNIVNDNSVDADFDVTVFDISDQLVGTTRVNIPAKTQFSRGIGFLIPELLPVPAEDFVGSIRISSVDNSTRFYALGVFVEGTEFTAFPATQLDTTSSSETVLVANFLNGNTSVLSSRVYLFNGSTQAGDVTARVFTTPIAGGIRQELTPDPLPLGNLGPKEAMNIKLDVDILTPLGIGLPYTTDGGNLTVEFTIGAENVHGVAQVFSSELAFGTYPMQVIQ